MVFDHVLLSTTQIYTRVLIRKLEEIHSATHPAARLERRPSPEHADDSGDDDIDELAADLGVEDDERDS